MIMTLSICTEKELEGLKKMVEELVGKRSDEASRGGRGGRGGRRGRGRGHLLLPSILRSLLYVIYVIISFYDLKKRRDKNPTD